jgi:predicted GTPase
MGDANLISANKILPPTGKWIRYLFHFLTMTANYHKPPVPVFIFMGTSGCGKSSVAAACQKILGCEVLEGDELHPKANIDKMSKGKSRCWNAMDKGAGWPFVEEGEGLYAK